MGATSTTVKHHAVLDRSFAARVRLTCETGLRVGAGRSPDMLASDLPVIKDASGKPLIPGSSLRGVLRSACEGVLAGVELRDWKPAAADDATGGNTEVRDVWEKMPMIERLFGNQPQGPGETHYASRLKVSDFRCVTDEVEIEVRDGVGIDRETRTAANRVKYTLEVVPAGTVFEGRVRILNPDDHEIGLLAQSLWMLDEGMVQLGGGSARGLGWVSVEVVDVQDRDARKILGLPPEEKPDEQHRPSVDEAEPGDGNGEDFAPLESLLGPYLRSFQKTIEEALDKRPEEA